MTRVPNEDLFESTKMTFGEHLEELRVALFKSLIGLVIGVSIGLMVADKVVEAIQGPLTEALKTFFVDATITDLTAMYGEPSESDKQFLRQEQLVFEEIYLEASEIARISSVSVNRSEENASEKTGGFAILDDVLPKPTSTFIKARLWKPINAKVKTLNAHEAFMIWLKAAIVTGIIISSPWVFYQIWNFVAAGLYPQEKNYVYLYLPISLGLFLLGAVLAFKFVFGPVLGFLFSFNAAMNIDPDPRISEWMSFVLMLPLGFGVSFQLPLIMLLLNRIGVFAVETYLDKWRVAVLVIFVASMFLTPADPISMLLMAAPLTVLYFGGIAMCKWMPKRKSPFGEGYDPA